LDVVCDPNVPIIPPHIDMAMLSKFSKAMIKGDPESSQVIRQVIKQAMQGGSSF
jgi:pyruvate dehydrogenase (quinone)